jgi:RNA polymerase sigma-54 factor
MAISLSKEQKQSQKISITPQLRKSIELLHLSRFELVQKIEREIETNPFLEKNDNELDVSNQTSIDDFDFDFDFAASESLKSYLLNQINDLNLSTSNYEISESIVNSIDETGRLADGLSEIEELLDYKYTYKTIENNLINIIHELSPSGVGFRDFKECIFLQIKKSNISDIELEIANKILYEISSDDLDECFNTLVYSGYDENDVKKTIQVIRNCDLSPGLNYEETNYIYPDLKITLESNDKISTQFVTDNFPSIVLDENFVKETQKALKKDPNEDLSKNIEEAKWLISSIRRRNETVLKVGEMICKRQIDFLGNNPLKVSPLTNKDISDELGVHPSTISRIIKSKYIDTPKGIIPLKSFLASSVSKTRMVTPLQLMDQIKKIIDEEKNPLSDQKIVQMLNLRGFGLARRTITKYRKQLNIPSSRNR